MVWRRGTFLAIGLLIFLTNGAFKTDWDEFYSTYTPIDSLSKYYDPLIKKKDDLRSSLTDHSESKIFELFPEIQSDLHLELTSDVLKHINHFVTGQKRNFEIALSLENYYRPFILKSVENLNMPDDIAYLPIVLSGMHNQAISPDGGVGIWKLNYFVGKKYGLTINKYLDERKDIEKSTDVALRYLNDLYKKYKSWNMAITAFAYSPAIVEKAIIRSGNQTNYWRMKPYLRPDAQQLVPSFFAAIYTTQFYIEHDLNPPGILISQDKEKLKIEEKVSIEILAKNLKITEQSLRMLNPTHRGKVLYPEEISGQPYFVPVGYNEQIIAFADLYKKSKEIIAPKKVKNVYTYTPAPIPANSKKVVYVVKSGDFLGRIAEAHGVGVSKVKRWNGLRSDRINIGQRLVIYVDKNKTITSAKSKKETTNTPQPVTSGNVGLYTIKEGDTLWSIAKEHPGNTIEGLQQLNRIGSNLKPGQVIKYLKE